MLKWFLVNTLTLLLITRILPGVHIDSWQNAAGAVLIIGIINITIKPILSLLTLPITFLTLGLFSLVLNTLMLLLAANITPGFAIDGFFTALVASVLNSLISGALNSLLEHK
jgi:putative membrane protein